MLLKFPPNYRHPRGPEANVSHSVIIPHGFLLPSYWHILSKATLKDGADKVTSRYLPSAYITAASDAFTLGVNPNSLNKASYFHRDGGFTTRYEINL